MAPCALLQLILKYNEIYYLRMACPFWRGKNYAANEGEETFIRIGSRMGYIF